jgi:hypothetical protein
VPLPPAASPAPTPAPASRVIETDEGDRFILQEPTLTARQGLRRRELRALPAEIRRRRRFWRNVVLYALGLLILATVFTLLVQLGR